MGSCSAARPVDVNAFRPAHRQPHQPDTDPAHLRPRFTPTSSTSTPASTPASRTPAASTSARQNCRGSSSALLQTVPCACRLPVLPRPSLRFRVLLTTAHAVRSLWTGRGADGRGGMLHGPRCGRAVVLHGPRCCAGRCGVKGSLGHQQVRSVIKKRFAVWGRVLKSCFRSALGGFWISF